MFIDLMTTQFGDGILKVLYFISIYNVLFIYFYARFMYEVYNVLLNIYLKIYFMLSNLFYLISGMKILIIYYNLKGIHIFLFPIRKKYVKQKFYIFQNLILKPLLSLLKNNILFIKK